MIKIKNPEIFTVWSDKVEGRIDPSFYRPEFKELEKLFFTKKLQIKTLKEVAEKISSGTTPLSGGDAYTDIEYGVPFIRSGDIKANSIIEFSDLLYIKKDVHRKKLKSSQLHRGDVLIAIVGATIGHVSLYDYDREANINQAIALVRMKEKVSPYYVKEYLLTDIGQNQLNKIKRPVARANINLDEVGSIKVPLPPKAIQDKVVSIMQKAYGEKRRKEKQAKELLDSIDEYVLGELGIEMPEIEKQMVFEVWSDEVRGRLDVDYYKSSYKNIIDAIKKGLCQAAPLGEITEFVMNGRTPSKDSYSSDQSDIPIIKAGTASGKLVNLEKVGYVKKNFKGKKEVAKGDIFILSAAHQAQYVGKNVSLLDEEPKQPTYFVGELIGVRTNRDKCSSDYLFSFLSSKLAYLLMNREKRGQTSHLYPEDLRTIKIPVPESEIQEKISKEVRMCREKAKKLEKEAQELLEDAKKEVEKIILG